MRHLPGTDVRQYRMSGIRKTSAGFDVVDLGPHLAVSPNCEPLSFSTLDDACAWADYIAGMICAALFGGDEPPEPSVKPIVKPLYLPAWELRPQATARISLGK
jgi:hypothetical protein